MIQRFFTSTWELNPWGQRVTKIVARVYALAIVLMCFLPQSVYPNLKDFTTPGIIQIGRVFFLPTPFNTLVHANHIETIGDFFLILAQNVTNVFLLYPLVLCLVFLFPSWRNWKRVLRNTFYMSLGIEFTQLILDLLIDAGRVVEVDDLWTNSLGGLLAYWTYLMAMKFVQNKKIG